MLAEVHGPHETQHCLISVDNLGQSGGLGPHPSGDWHLSAPAVCWGGGVHASHGGLGRGDGLHAAGTLLSWAALVGIAVHAASTVAAFPTAGSGTAATARDRFGDTLQCLQRGSSLTFCHAAGWVPERHFGTRWISGWSTSSSSDVDVMSRTSPAMSAGERHFCCKATARALLPETAATCSAAAGCPAAPALAMAFGSVWLCDGQLV